MFGYDISDDVIGERFKYFGGAARPCLSLDPEIAGFYLDGITDSIMKIRDRTDLLDLLSGKDDSVMLLVPRADNRTCAERQFASEFVVEKLAERLQLLAKWKKKAAVTLLCGLPEGASLIRYMFEISVDDKDHECTD